MDMHWYDGVFSDGSNLFVSNINPKLGDKVTIKLRFFTGTRISKVLLATLINGEERVFAMEFSYAENGFDYYSVKIDIVHHVTIYHFILIGDDGVWFYSQRGIDEHYPLKHCDFKILAGAVYPDWVHSAVFYQIFPDRFYNGDPGNDVKDGEYEHNGFKTKLKKWTDAPSVYREHGSVDFFGGDLDGIIAKIDYLKELGINAIYLNPIFKAYSNHKYDCIDFFHVDEHFGGDEALIRLTDALHKNGIRLILDISLNHVGKRHPWVKDKPEFFFYDKHGKIEGWNGISDLPVLNYNSPQLREIMYAGGESVLKKWLLPPYNADGWRFDVGQSTGLMNENKLDFDIWKEVRRELKSVKPDAYLFTEHWDDCICYLQGDMWDGNMNYYGFTRTVRKFLGDEDRFFNYKSNNAPLKRGAEIMRREVTEQYSMIPYSSQMCLLNLIASHDYARLSIVASKETQLLAPLFLFIFPGVPCIYYGDEAGLDGYAEQDSGYRFPMQWDEDKQDAQLLDLYRSLTAYRKSSKVLQNGSFKFLYTKEDTVGIARFDNSKCVLLLCSVTKSGDGCAVRLDPAGRFTKCKAVGEIGPGAWSFENNTVTASFNGAAGVLLELE